MLQKFNVRWKSGQSIIEYLLMSLTVLVIVIFLVQKNGGFSQTINKVLFMPDRGLDKLDTKIQLYQIY